MNKITLDRAIEILKLYGYKESKILKMDVYQFIDAVNKNIGTFDYIELTDRRKEIKGGK